MTEAETIALLKEEYFKLQDIVESFDERALQIKGWSVTVSLVGMGAAITAHDLQPYQRATALALASLAALCFWLIEWLWKSFQWTFFHRIDAIEDAIKNGTVLALPPLQIRHSFHANLKKDLRANIRKATKPFIMLPHAGVALFGVVLASQYL
jgi:hypothetical protein